MNFIKIKKGSFMMGSPESETGRSSYETQREVKIEHDFEIMDALVTQKEWEEIMGNNPSYFKGGNNPVEQVSFNDVKRFIKKINKKDELYLYRLPTEEEWEYCCRAGTTTAYSFGNDPKSLKQYAWFCSNSRDTTHPVKQKKPNAWDLYDMHGNVWEWTNSVYYGYDYDRVIRGGSWDFCSADARSARRYYGIPYQCYYYVGFRLVRTLRSSLLPSNTDPVACDSSNEEAKNIVKQIRAKLSRLEKLLK